MVSAIKGGGKKINYCGFTTWCKECATNWTWGHTKEKYMKYRVSTFPHFPGVLFI